MIRCRDRDRIDALVVEQPLVLDRTGDLVALRRQLLDSQRRVQPGFDLLDYLPDDLMVFVDESHASGFIGKRGRGTHEHCGVLGRIDIVTTTLGKALGGASGGCVSGRAELVVLNDDPIDPVLLGAFGPGE